MLRLMQEFDGPLIFDTKPKHRVFTTLCPLVDPNMVGKALCPGAPPVEQTLLLLWGKEHLELIVDDCWLLHGDDMTWTKVNMMKCHFRHYHAGTSPHDHGSSFCLVEIESFRDRG